LPAKLYVAILAVASFTLGWSQTQPTPPPKVGGATPAPANKLKAEDREAITDAMIKYYALKAQQEAVEKEIEEARKHYTETLSRLQVAYKSPCNISPITREFVCSPAIEEKKDNSASKGTSAGAK
jgi:hypothetical protein